MNGILKHLHDAATLIDVPNHNETIFQNASEQIPCENDDNLYYLNMVMATKMSTFTILINFYELDIPL